MNTRSVSRLPATRVIVNVSWAIGPALATCISWSLNKAILWAILHGLLGWLYIGYYAFYLRAP